MRTKVLLCAAALAASLASSTAQNVYSLNVVGYVNITLQEKFNCVANPLDATMGVAGSKLNNLTNLFQNMGDQDYVQVWSPAANDYTQTITYYADPPGWDNSDLDMPVGRGFMYYRYDGNGPKAVTFVGNVVQGPYTMPTLLDAKFAQVGAPAPLGGPLTNSLLGVVPADGDYVQIWSNTANDWVNTTTFYPPDWSPADTQIPVASGFFYYRYDGNGDFPWQSNFTVQ